MDGFPQEAFPRHQLALLPQLELEIPPHGRYDERQFHLRDVPSDARSSSVAERDECPLLLFGQMFWVPTIRIEDVGIKGWIVGWIPDRREMVDRVGGDGEDGALGKIVVADRDAGAGRDDAGKAEGGGGVDAEGFRDYVV